MKNLLTILTLSLIFLLTGCENLYLKDSKSKINQAKETNYEILSKIDTNKKYYILPDDETLYAINTSTKIVEYKTVDSSGLVTTILLICVILIFGLGIISTILD